MFPHKNLGFSLLEVLLALFIFSVGLLALAKIQIMVIRRQNTALLRSIAMQQVTNLAELLIFPHWRKQHRQWYQQWQQQLTQHIKSAQSKWQETQLQLCWQTADITGVINDQLKQTIKLP